VGVAEAAAGSAAGLSGEIVGFVKYDYNGMNPGEQQQVAGLSRVNVRNCWVVDVSPPSWVKGLGMVVGGLAIPGVFGLWKLKNPGLS
jgi:hypothetical protein